MKKLWLWVSKKKKKKNKDLVPFLAWFHNKKNSEFGFNSIFEKNNSSFNFW
jgi:hypothetical protein